MTEYKLLQWYPGLPQKWKEQGPTIVTYNPSDGCYYADGYSRPFPDWVIENNPEFWETLKDYKILTLKGLNNHEIHEVVDGEVRASDGRSMLDVWETLDPVELVKTHVEEWKINSIERTHDRVQMELGDHTQYGLISGFAFRGDDLEVMIDEDPPRRTYPLDEIRLSKVVFTTEDGVDILEGQQCWAVLHNAEGYPTTYFQTKSLTLDNYSPGERILHFSTQEEAQKYYEDYKIRFSKAELKEMVEDSLVWGVDDIPEGEFVDKELLFRYAKIRS